MKWNEFATNIREYFRTLREDQRLFDVTLVTDDGQHIQAHKIILSAGSHFFSDIFLKSNQTNMLIYLKGINSIQLEHLLDFIYNGEASIGQEELKEFLETGKELQVKGFEAYVSGVGESAEEDPIENMDEKEDMYENRNDITGDIISGTFEPSPEQHDSSEVSHTGTNDGKSLMNANSDLKLQLSEIIEKSDGVWKCKVCGKTDYHNNIQRHAESHIKGMSYVCHICSKSFPNRNGLRVHIDTIHSELLTCNLCGKSGMNKKSYKHNNRTQH